MAVNYVKFYRGSMLAYENSIKNQDTLYFITDSDSNKSALYLGDKLIAGNISELADLEDILISKPLEDNHILVFNEQDQKWNNKAILDAVSLMTGATATTQGGAGLVPAPGIGQHEMFLRGDGNWVNISTSSSDFVADEKTIEIINETTFSLKDFGKKYYKYIHATGSQEEGNFVASHYELQIVDADHPWSEGLEPKVVKENDIFVLGWFEPNPTLLEGVVDSLSSLQNQIDNTVKNVEDLSQSLNILNNEISKKADNETVYTKQETVEKINEIVSKSQHLTRKTFDTLEEANAFVASVVNPSDFVYMVKNTLNPTSNDKYIEYLYINDSLEAIGGWDVNLDNYVTETELVDALKGKVNIETGKTLISLEELDKLSKIADEAERNVINSVNSSEFKVIDRNLELNMIPISKVANLESLLNSKADQNFVDNLQLSIQTVSGKVELLETKTITLEDSIKTISSKVTDLEELLNSSYVSKEDYDADMETIYNSIIWKTL